MLTSKRAVSVLFDSQEYARLVRKAAELTLAEGRRVSVAELVRRATLSEHIDDQNSSNHRTNSSTES